jgi:hypothetical protein
MKSLKSTSATQNFVVELTTQTTLRKLKPQAFCRVAVIAEARVHSQTNPCVIFREKEVLGQDSSKSFNFALSASFQKSPILALFLSVIHASSLKGEILDP